MSTCVSWLDNLEEFSELLQLIAEPHRLRILCVLAENCKKLPEGICVSEMVELFQEPQNLISHHLGMLKRAQLVLAKREGKNIRYRLNTEVYQQLRNSLKIIFRLK